MSLRIFTAVAVSALFSACRKNPASIQQPPSPAPEDSTSYIQFTAGEIPVTGQNLFVMISARTVTNQPVFTNRKIRLNRSGSNVYTDKLPVERGTLFITSFVIVNEGDTAVYVTPKSGSAKATSVSNPLSYPVTVSQRGVKQVFLEVLNVKLTDTPADFGYSHEEFGLQPLIELKVKLKITVGRTEYDSLPGKLEVDAAYTNGQHWIREFEMQGGVTSIRVPENAAVFSFEATHWNSTAQRVYLRTNLGEGMLIGLDATREPLRMFEEASYIENLTGWVPDSRSEFQYDGAGRLLIVKYYQRSLQVNGLPLTHLYYFVYNNGRPDSIKRFAPDQSPTGFTAFTYTGDNITSVFSRSYDQESMMAAEHTRSGNTGYIDADYLFSNGQSMTYRITIRNGNKMHDQALSSTGAGESGVYEYDRSINPRHHLGWPDIYFSHLSKNNLTRETKSYGGAFPSAVPYKTEYRYNSDGYPVEAFTSYKGYSSQQHLYRIKKTYSYR